MASTFTPNINLEEPARGDDVGTWDTPVNSNMTVIDLTVGAVNSIAISGNVVLSAAQFRSRMITLTGALAGNATVTFPSSFVKDYKIFNQTTQASSQTFVVTLATTGSSATAQRICPPPGEITSVYNDGTNINFTDLGRVGSYMDIATATVPAWITGCSPQQPYLACTGTTFSSATYPQLTAILGSTTTPDSRGRTRFALDAGVGRVSSAVSGLAGNTLAAGGGDQNSQAHNHSVSDPGHVHNFTQPNTPTPGFAGGSFAAVNGSTFPAGTSNSVTGLTVNSFGSGAAQNIPPAYVGGITMIRAA